MKGKLKNFIIITLIISIVMQFIPTYTEATTSMDELRRMYPNYYQWNDDYYGNTACHGFACLIYDNYYGINPIKYAEKCYDLNQIEPGDIVRYNGHTVLILSRNGESTTVVECNYDWKNHVRWDEPKSFDEFRNNFDYIYKAPYPLGGSPKPAEAPKNVKVDTSDGVNISWSKANNCIGYKVKIYNKETGEMVDEINIARATTLSTKVYSLKTATYTVKVYGVRFDNVISSNYGEATFSWKEEADSFSVYPSNKTILVGESFKFNVTLWPSNGVCKIKFYADEDTDKSIIQIDDDGTITGLKEGTTEVGFEFKTSRTKAIRSFPVKVIKPLKLQETEKRMEVNQTSKLELSSCASDAYITWNSNDKKIATVDESGNVKALSAGTVKITATQYLGGTESSDTCTITITDPNVYAEGITLDQKTMTIENVGGKALLKATITPSNTTDKTVTWKSSKVNVATVNEQGWVTAVGEGTTEITAKTSNGKIASCIVTVPKQIKCNLNYNIYTFKSLTETLNLQASLTENYSSSFTYESTNEKILKVDNTGKVTPITGGFADIYVRDNIYGKSSVCSCYVQVPITLSDGSKAYVGDMNRDGLLDSVDASIILSKYKSGATADDILIGDVNGDGILTSVDSSIIQSTFKNGYFCPGKYYPITGINLDKTELILNIGNTKTLQATIEPIDTTDSPKLTWSSNNECVKVDQNGKITAIAKGKATITVTTTNNKTAICTISVEDKQFIKGDMNKDEKINSADASIIIDKFTSGKYTSEDLEIGDMNNDGKLNAIDASLVLDAYKKQLLIN